MELAHIPAGDIRHGAVVPPPIEPAMMQSGDDDRNNGGGNEKADGRSDEKIRARSRQSSGGKASVQEQRFGEWFCAPLRNIYWEKLIDNQKHTKTK